MEATKDENAENATYLLLVGVSMHWLLAPHETVDRTYLVDDLGVIAPLHVDIDNERTVL